MLHASLTFYLCKVGWWWHLPHKVFTVGLGDSPGGVSAQPAPASVGCDASFMGGRSVSSQVGSTLREAGLTWGPGGARLILWLLSSALRVHRLLTLPLPYWPGSLAMWRGGSAHVLTVPCRGHITEGVW